MTFLHASSPSHDATCKHACQCTRLLSQLYHLIMRVILNLSTGRNHDNNDIQHFADNAKSKVNKKPTSEIHCVRNKQNYHNVYLQVVISYVYILVGPHNPHQHNGEEGQLKIEVLDPFVPMSEYAYDVVIFYSTLDPLLDPTKT